MHLTYKDQYANGKTNIESDSYFLTSAKPCNEILANSPEPSNIIPQSLSIPQLD